VWHNLQQKLDKRYGSWNVRSLDKSGALTIVERELSGKHLVGIRVRWNKGGTEPTKEYASVDEETISLNRNTIIGT